MQRQNKRTTDNKRFKENTKANFSRTFRGVRKPCRIQRQIIGISICLPSCRPYCTYTCNCHLASDRKTFWPWAHFLACASEEDLKPPQLSSFDQTKTKIKHIEFIYTTEDAFFLFSYFLFLISWCLPSLTRCRLVCVS